MGLRRAALGFERFAVIHAVPGLEESGGRLIECLDVPVGTGEHRTAFQRGHDVERPRFRIGTASISRSAVSLNGVAPVYR